MLLKYGNEFALKHVPNCTGQLTEDEVEVAQMYCVLVLKKIRTEEDDMKNFYLYNEPLGKNQKEIGEDDIHWF